MDDASGHAILNAQTVEECIIEQRWKDYTDADHATWRTLYNRQLATLKGNICQEYLDGLTALHLGAETVPDYEKMNRHLRAATGWEVLPVPGLIASKPFFTMLSNKQFPAGTFIRKPEQLDYLEEPDIFHDVFGHIPLLTNPSYAAYMQEYGRAGLAALEHKGIKFLARLNWYTIEFGLLRSEGNFKIYGAGIISSFGETKYVISDPSPNFVQFDLERVLRTGYYIDDFQSTYFVIDDFNTLFEALSERPFTALYEEYRKKPTLTPFELGEEDVVLRRGSNEYTKNFPALKTKLK
jgi:phenylalanine-4-hydroxylase